MFGYVTVNQQELKLKEYDSYRAYYCGLCRVLKEQYGRVGQMTLTYDMTFLVILLTGLYEPSNQQQSHRCLAHPTQSHPMLTNTFTEYAAAMNILLAYHNCMDDWFDDKSFLKLSSAKLLEGKYKSLKVRYPRQTQAIETYIENVHKGEKEHSANLDLISGHTGTLLGELFIWKEDEWSDILRRMGYFLGKFIYLMDACEDLKQDTKKDHYNPWSSYQNKDNFKNFCHDILTMMMADCAREFEKLPIITNAEILRNIIYSGVWTRYEILSEKEKQETH